MTAEFEHSFRVESALSKANAHEDTKAAQWRECVSRWGPESPAAIGCVQAIAEDLHGFPLCAYQPRAGGWAIESAHDHGESYASDPAKTRSLAWVECLEGTR